MYDNDCKRTDAAQTEDVRTIEIITDSLLSRFADENKKKFEGLLPELVKRLIQESSDARWIRIPQGEDIWAPGFDGYIECEKGNTFIPEGKSIWEFGVSKNYMAKIQSDYKKRTEGYVGTGIKEVTIVLVTPRIWTNKRQTIQQWEASHDDWKATHVIDGVRLRAWINSIPAVYTWLYEQITGCQIFVSTVSRAWESFSHKTEPRLTEALFQTGRDEEREKLCSLLMPGKIVKVKAESNLDASGFVLSTLCKDPDFSNKAVVVRDKDSLEALLREHNTGIFFLDGDISGDCQVDDNTVILRFNKEKQIHPDINLHAIPKRDFLSSMSTMGLSAASADELYYHTKGNLRVLIRRIPGTSIDLVPDWKKLDSERYMLALLFLKHYNRESAEEKQVVEDLIGVPYGIIENRYLGLNRLEDTPVKILDNTYSVVSYEETWETLRPSIDEEAFDRLTGTIVRLLEDTGKESVPVSLAVHGFTNSVFENLLDNFVYFAYENNGSDKLNSVIKRVLGYLYRTECSDIIIGCLYQLAEAAPKQVLQAIIDDLKRKDSIFTKALNDTSYSSRRRMTLYAIEKLTECEETAVEACKLLFSLFCDEKDVSKQEDIRKRMLHTLCLWDRHGVLELREKEGLIRYFQNSKPKEGTELAISLLKKKSNFHGFRYGRKRKESEIQISIPAYQKTIEEIGSNVFSYALKFGDSLILKDLLEQYDLFSAELLGSFAERFECKAFDPRILTQIDYQIRDNLFRIQKYDQTERKHYLNVLQRWAEVVGGEDFVCQIAWMFQSVYCLPTEKFLKEAESDYQNKLEKAREIRISMLRRTWGHGGEPALVRLASLIPDDHYWGELLAETAIEFDAFEMLAEGMVQQAKIITLGGFLNLIPENAFLKIYKNLPEGLPEKLLPILKREDCTTWLDSEEHRYLYWSTKEMRSYKEEMFLSLLKYHPEGLIAYCWDRSEKDPAGNQEKITKVFQALSNTEKSADSERFLYSDFLTDIIHNMDRQVYSDQWALLCWNLLRRGLIQEFSEGMRIFFFQHPEQILKECEKGNRFEFDYRFQLPESAYKQYDEFQQFAGFLFDNGQERLLGSILGRTIQPKNGWDPHPFVCEILEEKHDDKLEASVIDGYINNLDFRTGINITDEMEVKHFRSKIRELRIQFSRTAYVLERICYINEKREKEERVFDEIESYE